jgi:2,3-bisphosphoglycerate-independent phosphoglycerate mutase
MIKFILIILDGFGLRKEEEGNAVAQANTPNLDKMMNNCPLSKIETSGKFVGLPDGIMGNSEVGHMNMGAGRIVKQDLVRINDSIKSNELKNNTQLQNIFNHVKNNDSTMHIMGLISDGGVHSHLDHFEYILAAARKNGVEKIAIHAFMDGRDTSPVSGINFMNKLENFIASDKKYKVATVCGRYYAMDRDNRWERIEKAYKMLINSQGENYTDAVTAIQSYYDKDITDEFINPSIIGEQCPIQNGDAVFSMNFRADRMRQMVTAINDSNFSHFQTKPLDILFTTMTEYQKEFPYSVLFEPEKIDNIFPELLARNNYRQLRIAETEKYAHVTYFFNGGSEQPFPGETRKLIPSPKVATYDLQPEMSAPEVTDEVLLAIESDKYEAIIMNFANPDMVGHTGNIKAAITAIETIDSCLEKIQRAANEKDAAIFLTADHGNLELMHDPLSGVIHTAHTTLPVPLILVNVNGNYQLAETGKLADIAPTILDYLKIEKPLEMTGNSLLISTHE